MKVLIVTKSFVREVSSFVKYAQISTPSIRFSLAMPYCHEKLPAELNIYPLYLSSHMRASFYPARSLLSQIRKFQPDVVHVFEEFSGLMAFQTTLFSSLFCRRSKIMIYSAENIRHNVRLFLRTPMKYVMKRADLAFVCSHGVKHVLKHEGFSKEIRVFPLGVDTSEFYKFSAHSLKEELKLDGKLVLGYVGRLLRIKGIFLLLEMLCKLPENVHLLMIGAGPEEQNLRQAAARLGLEKRIHILGEVLYQQLPGYINCMDIGIVPSNTSKRWKEQFGRVLVEMMSCEIPVIGSDSGSIPEVLGDSAQIFRDGEASELVMLVRRLIDSGPDTRSEIGRKGRQRVKTLYTTERMYSAFLTIYQGLLDDK